MPKKAKKKLELTVSELTELLDRLPNLFVKGGVALYGAKAFNHPAGALIGLVALELAKARNVAAGMSGVVTLASIGLAQHAGKPPIPLGTRIPVDIPRLWPGY